ncbi:MAG TPA: ABC transporter permease [Spirochaetota bacterium]|nr:ABC transporter permease [Spirochaetota bacterium]HPN83598.1 ABC transporter permease [Spirochaetota bacterium]
MEYLVSFLAAAVVAGIPLLFATVGEIITERAGNLNLGVEGMMLMGAVVGFLVGLTTKNAPLAILAAAMAGAFGAAIFAFLTITLRTNQVVTGLSLTIFGAGFSTMIGNELIGEVAPSAIKEFFKPFTQTLSFGGLDAVPAPWELDGLAALTPVGNLAHTGHIPVLGDIPVIGRIFFQQDMFVYIGYAVAILAGIYLYRTRMGLNLRAVGENPGAADASSINVSLYKYVHILIGGALCGLGGAYLSLVYVPAWQENVTAGRGWIAIALVIFSGWNPYKALSGAFLFGALSVLPLYFEELMRLIIGVPVQLTAFWRTVFDMMPYLVTIAVLFLSTLKFRKNAPPAGLGLPFFREER